MSSREVPIRPMLPDRPTELPKESFAAASEAGSSSAWTLDAKTSRLNPESESRMREGKAFPMAGVLRVPCGRMCFDFMMAWGVRDGVDG